MKKIDEKIAEGRQYRNAVEFRISEPSEGTDELIVEGHACTFNEPYELCRYHDSWEGKTVIIEEQIDPSAFDECDMTDVIMQYDHAGRVFARTKNKTLTISTDEEGLSIRADLSKSDGGPGLYKDIKNGTIDKMSFGFTVVEDIRNQTTNEEDETIRVLRTITKVGKLYDVSAVSFPANDGTDISARSICEGVIAELEAERLQKRERILRMKKLNLMIEIEKEKSL